MTTIGLAALIGALVIEPGAKAEPSIVERGAACPAGTVHARVRDYLGSTSLGALAVQTTLRQHPDRWSLRVRIDDAAREFESPDCATVIDAAAFVIATTVDPSIAQRQPPVTSEPSTDGSMSPPPASATTTDVPPLDEVAASGTPDPPVEPQEHDEPDVPTAAPRPNESSPAASTDAMARTDRRLRAVLGAELGIDLGALPSTGLLIRPFAGVQGPRWRAVLTGAFRTRSRVTSSADPSAGGDLGLWAVGARGCGLPRLLRPRLELPLCGGVEAGQTIGRGFGFEGARDASIPWLAITASPGIGWAPIPRLSIALHGEVGLAPLRGEWVIDRLGLVHSLGLVFGRVTVGLRILLGARTRS